MYQFAILLSKSIPEVLILQIQEALKEYDFFTHLITRANDKILLIYQHNLSRIEETLSDLHIELPKYHRKSAMQTTSRRFHKYQQFIKVSEYLDSQIKEMEQYARFKHQSRHKFIKDGDTDLDIPNDIMEIAIYQILATIPVNSYITDVVASLNIKQNSTTTKFLFVYLKSYSLIEDVCPLRTFRHSTLSELKQSYVEGLGYIVSQVKIQMGEQAAIYFAFLLYLMKAMTILVLLGVITYVLDEVFNFDVTTSPFESLYAALTILWGAYFVGKWTQKQKQYSTIWRSRGDNYEIFHKNIELSLIQCLTHEDHFEIEKQVQQIEYSKELDPVTGEFVQFKKEAYKLYLSSFLQTFPYILILNAFLIISLNARGYIAEDGFLHIAFLQQWAKPGEIFDPNAWGSFTLTVIHVIVVFYLGLKYKEVSISTTLQEAHESLESYETSLIIKRFVFEMFSAFLDFFYIGFILADIIKLRSEMVSMFAVDEIRRIVTETIIPSIQKLQLQRQIHQFVDLMDHPSLRIISQQLNNTNIDKIKYHLKSQLISVYLPKYESFDDYLEIILNFGYLCFFTSAYRMAGIIICLFLLLEFLSDYYKIYHLYQKPFAMKAQNIGPWVGAMDVITVCSVFTNLLLFSIASDQIVEFFPWLFVQTPQMPMLLTAAPLPGKKSEVVTIIFILEHVLLLLIYFVKKIIRNKRSWADIYEARKLYRHKLL